MANTHEYPIVVNWTGGREGGGTTTHVRSNTTNTLSVPPEFQGPGNGTNPEEMLTSAIASCYSITLGIVLANRKLAFDSIKTEAVGEVDQAGAAFTYARVTLKPIITLPTGSTVEQVNIAEEMAHKADAYCIITNAVRGKTEIIVEPTIVIG